MIRPWNKRGTESVLVFVRAEERSDAASANPGKVSGSLASQLTQVSPPTPLLLILVLLLKEPSSY